MCKVAENGILVLNCTEVLNTTQGPTKAVFSEEAEEVWHVAWDPQQLLQLHCWEHPGGSITMWYGSASAVDRKWLQSGKDCWEDHQEPTALSAEHLPPQSPQESCLHPQRPYPSPAWTVHTSTLRPEIQKCSIQDQLFFPTAIRILNSGRSLQSH